MKYPTVLSEDETLLRAAAGCNLSRFGDGELRIAVGGEAVSQREKSPKMRGELLQILKEPRPGVLVCIPNAKAKNAKPHVWDRYAADQFVRLYDPSITYGSSFITRPDSAPWIDREDYWKEVRGLWKGREAILVAGDGKSIDPEMVLRGALGVAPMVIPPKDAYREIDAIEDQIIREHAMMRNPVVLMCAGVTATILAWRLAGRGIYALDLGHIGMFMKHAGAYRYAASDLSSPAYQRQLQKLHRSQSWGKDGSKHVTAVQEYAAELGASTILDYGCGQGMLARGIKKIRVYEYDPGIPAKSVLPKPADLVACTDVLEHVEPDRIGTVLDHIRRLAGKGVYFVIATRKANAVLPDGRNAHLIIRDAKWWTERLLDAGFQFTKIDVKEGREVRIWANP